MCGIVGLFIRDKALQPRLGQLLSDMLATMCDRGPDSAGFAVYGDQRAGFTKLTLQAQDPRRDFDALESILAAEFGAGASLQRRGNHAVLSAPSSRQDHAQALIASRFPDLKLIAIGETMEIYKDVGRPTDVVRRFGLETMQGTHGVGHTRMATESAVTTLGAHPFSTGADQCLVHNGSLSNHNNLRRNLRHDGVRFETENDSEVAAAYLTQRMKRRSSLSEALAGCLDDLDGFYTFVVGAKTGLGVLRDPIACKPAVMAETAQYVAFGSEYRALAGLPDIAVARVWEPEPATVYVWEH